jgi:hypothetical protein
MRQCASFMIDVLLRADVAKTLDVLRTKQSPDESVDDRLWCEALDQTERFCAI